MKRFLTTLCLLLALCVTNSFAVTYYMQEDFNNGLNGWKSVDLDGNKLSSTGAQYLNYYFGTSYTTSTTTGWEALHYKGNASYEGYVVSCSSTSPTTAVDDWLISPEITLPASNGGLKVQYSIFPLSSQAADGYELYVTDASLTDPKPTDFTTMLTSESAASGDVQTIDLDAYAGKTIRLAFRNHSTNKLMLILDNVLVFQADDYDLIAYQTDVPNYVNADNANGTSFNIAVASLGYKDVKSFDVTWQADGEDAHTQTVTNSGIAYAKIVTVPLTTPWKPTKLGQRVVTFTISNINGTNATDGEPTNNVIYDTCNVWNSTTATSFVPLYELFTSSTCGPCYSVGETYGNTALLDKNVTNKGLVLVKYQMNWPGNGDPYYNADGGTRKDYYEVSGVPAAFANGASYEFNDANLSQTGIDALFEHPGTFTIENATYQIDAANKKVTVNATIKPYADCSSSNVYARVAVFENKTTGNASSNGETEFHHVEMKMLPSATGTKITNLKAGQETTISLTGDMSSTFVEEMNDLGVAIFVQDDADKSILQAGYATLKTSAVEDNNDGNGFTSIYPNPTADYAHVEYAVKGNNEVNFNLFDEAGNVVYTQNLGMMTDGYYTQNIDVKALAAGQYFLRMTIGGRTFTNSVKIVR